MNGVSNATFSNNLAFKSGGKITTVLTKGECIKEVLRKGSLIAVPASVALAALGFKSTSPEDGYIGLEERKKNFDRMTYEDKDNNHFARFKVTTDGFDGKINNVEFYSVPKEEYSNVKIPISENLYCQMKTTPKFKDCFLVTVHDKNIDDYELYAVSTIIFDKDFNLIKGNDDNFRISKPDRQYYEFSSSQDLEKVIEKYNLAKPIEQFKEFALLQGEPREKVFERLSQMAEKGKKIERRSDFHQELIELESLEAKIAKLENELLRNPNNEEAREDLERAKMWDKSIKHHLEPLSSVVTNLFALKSKKLELEDLIKKNPGNHEVQRQLESINSAILETRSQAYAMYRQN